MPSEVGTESALRSEGAALFSSCVSRRALIARAIRSGRYSHREPRFRSTSSPCKQPWTGSSASSRAAARLVLSVWLALLVVSLPFAAPPDRAPDGRRLRDARFGLTAGRRLARERLRGHAGRVAVGRLRQHARGDRGQARARPSTRASARASRASTRSGWTRPPPTAARASTDPIVIMPLIVDGRPRRGRRRRLGDARAPAHRRGRRRISRSTCSARARCGRASRSSRRRTSSRRRSSACRSC